MNADILACWGESWIDKAISFITRNRITHIAMIVNQEYGLIVETGWFGVKIGRVSDKGKNYSVLRCVRLNELERLQICMSAISLMGRSYDYLQMLQLFLYKLFNIRINIGDRDKFICDEVILRAYKSIGLDLLPGVDDEYVFPHDLLESKQLINIGEGVLG